MVKTECLISGGVFFYLSLFNSVSLSLSLSSVLVLHVVRGFLFLGEPVAGDPA